MKTVLITFCLVFSSFTGLINQESIRVSGIYDRYEDGVYYFTSDQGASFEFQDISEEAAESVDLMDADMIGKLFSITFTSELGEEDDMEYNTIIALKILE